jgi:cobalt-zinc-cadmium efflux system membrane fusion protein
MMKFLIVFGFAALWFSCSPSPEKTDLAAPETESLNVVTLSAAQQQTGGIETGVFETKRLADQILVNGVADVPPQNIVSISFPLGGYLKSTKLLPGMRVQKGEVIGLMEDQQLVGLQESYLTAKEHLRYLELEYNRQKELNDNQVNALKTFQQVQRDLGAQKIQVRSMEEKLKLIGIDPVRLTLETMSRSVPLRSPINGFVSKILVNIGKYVQPSDVLFELIDPGDLHAAFSVFQKDMENVSVDQEVTISLVNKPEKIYRGRVILVNRNLDDSRTAMIHCHFIDHPASLLPGMFLNGRIRTAPRDVLAVPEQAVVKHEGKQFVFTSTLTDQFTMTPVKTGTRENGYLEILNAADIQGKVVVKNAYTLLGALKNVAEE